MRPEIIAGQGARYGCNPMARMAARMTIAAVTGAGAFAAIGCGGESTTSTTSSAATTATGSASVEEVVDQHPDVVAIVCRSTEAIGHEHSGDEHSHHEHSDHDHSDHEHPDHEHAEDDHEVHVAEIDNEALGYVGPLAIEAGVPPAKLLDEFVSRC
jgi:hypothetical protein